MKRFSLVALILRGIIMVSPPASAAGVSSPRVMLVLDASGSMWGQINGEAKIIIARRVIQDLLSGWDSRIELGLSVYGHRRKADCGDIETLVPVGSNTAKLVLEAVQTINPRGKTPLSRAVELAARELKYTEDKATVILISDGEETCDADPCALGAALEKDGVDFTTHVIGFGIQDSQSEGLKCLAENTGGQYTPARDAGTLKSALEKTVVAVKQAAPPPPEPAENGIKLVALYGPDGPEFKSDINWLILAKEKDLSGKRQKIADKYRGRSGHIFKDLPAGDFIAVAELSNAKYIRREFEISVAHGDSKEIRLPLNIGTVRFDALVSQGGKTFPGDLGWTVLDPKKDLSGKQRKLTDFWRVRSGGIFILPAGTWDIAGVFADAKYMNLKRQISVAPAGEEAHEFVFDAARVRFDARLAKDGVAYPGDLGWTVLSPKKDLSGSHQKLTEFWRVKSGSLFWLPKGEWLVKGVVADFKYISADQTLSLAPGDESPFEFIFNAANVKLAASLSENSGPYTGDLGWTVLSPKKDLSGSHQKLTEFWRVRSGRVVLLPAGEWLVNTVLADYKHVGTQMPLALSPGEDQTLHAVFNAGIVKIDFTSGGSPWKGQVGWEIFLPEKDLAGNQQKITSAWRVAAGTQVVLPQGRYDIRAVNPDDKALKASGSFEVSPGQEQVLTLDMKK